MTVASGLRFALAKRADELLSDGEWHSVEQVARELMKLVPPGQAHRRIERNRQTARASHAAEIAARGGRFLGPQPVGLEETLTRGRRKIVMEFLSGSRFFEFDRPGMPGSGEKARTSNRDRQIRMTGKHMALRGDPYRIERDQLHYENEMLHERLDRFIAYLKDNGHADAIDPLIAGPEVPP